MSKENVDLVDEFYGTEEQLSPEYVRQVEDEYLSNFGKVIFQS